MMSETWADEKDWNGMKRLLPKGYVWTMQEARKEHVKGRGMGGMVSGVRKEFVVRGRTEEDREEKDGTMVRRIVIGKVKITVVCVYRRRGEEEGWRVIRRWMEEKKEELVLIGGDLNAWTGEQGGGLWDEEKEAYIRNSRHRETDREGRRLLDVIGETGWSICNGNMKGDEKGEITFIGKGETVIDYILVEERMRNMMDSMNVGNEIGSEHFPVIATLKGGGRKHGRGRKERGGERNTKMGIWGVEKLKEFKQKMEEEKVRYENEEGVDSLIERLKGSIEKVRDEIGTKEEGDKGKRGWWDEECRESKERMKECLRQWRKGELEKADYNRRKREHERMLERKKQKGKEEYKEEVEKAIKEGRVWDVINRERGGRKGVNEEIEMGEWTDYFKGLLGGEQNRSKGEKRRLVQEEIEEGNEITREEVDEAVDRLKRNKATGEDGMENEAIKYGGVGVREEMWKICNKVWKGEGWPEEWMTGLVVPLVKKGEGKKVEEYRGITLMPVGYKIYAEILRNRLERQIEGKQSIPHNQTGFRKGMGTIDNIYVLNYLVNRNLGRKRGKLVALFIDFKAAFDSVNRKVLWKAMKERGIEEGLVERIKEIFTETRIRVKIRGEKGEVFWTGRGLRQGCPLSPLLFNMLLADLEEKLKEKGKGGTILGNSKLYSLAYADDVVLLADDEKGMNLMIRIFEEYVGTKELTVNVGKTKVMCFRSRKTKIGYVWKMNGQTVERVEEFCYLGFWFEAGGGNEVQVRKRIECASKVMGQVWGIGKRRFNDDWRMRVWLFDALVWAVLCYGVEIWGWKEHKKVESMHERFLRWVMGVSWSCPGYMIREELGREKMITRQIKRAWRFEEKLKRGEGSRIAQACLIEVRDKETRGNLGNSKWEEEREKMRRACDIQEGVVDWQNIELELLVRQGEERWRKIMDSRYNRWYMMVKGLTEPEYLQKIRKEEKWNRVIRFRMGEGVRACRYWMNEEDNLCRVCGYEIESWGHVLERCTGEEDGQLSVDECVRWILDGNGQGVMWMKKLEELRESKGTGESQTVDPIEGR